MPIPDIRPIYISGVYRSGTTLLSRILDNHPQLSVTYDNVHFMRFCFGQFDPINLRDNYLAVLNNIKERVDFRMKTDFDLGPIIEYLDGLEVVEYADVYHAVMSNLIADSPGNQWGEKTMIRWTYVPDFLGMFPQGKVIHILRDTRDVVASYKRVTNEPGLRYLDAIFATKHSMDWARLEGARLPEQNFLVVRYEDLVADPQYEVRRMCKMLEVGFDERMLDHTRFTDRSGQAWQGNSAYAEPGAVTTTADGLQHSVNGIKGDSVGRFRGKLADWEIYLAELVARDPLTHYGYELTGIDLDDQGWAELRRVLDDEFVSGRYRYWLKTNQGVEAYPSSPPQVHRTQGLKNHHRVSG